MLEYFSNRPVVTVLRLNGVIGGRGTLRPGLSAAGLAPLIKRAFAPKRLTAVALRVNSPGGSPVQSALIAAAIRRAAARRGVPVLAFCEDAAASGGYWLALAGDEIFADANSIVGSIGVVYAGFGFTGLLEKLGIERRLRVSGAAKGMLDPFQPEKPEDLERLAAIQRAIHDDFIREVRDRRGKRLKGEDSEVFSGAFWHGRRALDLGLIDGLGQIETTVRARFGDGVVLRPVNPSGRSWPFRLMPFGRGAREGAASPDRLADAVVASIEERLAWARLGL